MSAPRLASAVLPLVALLTAPAAIAGTIDSSNLNDYTLNLVGQNTNSSSISNGFAYEFDNYIGPVWDMTFDWTGTNVNLGIDGATGDAVLSGSMLRDGTSDVYTFQGTYSGFFTADRDFRGSFGDDEFKELLTGSNTSSFIRYDLDIAWSSATLDVYDENGGLFASMVGKDDTRTSAYDVAELQIANGKLDFGAWWSDADGLGRADSKAFGNAGPSSSPVPEPGAAALFGLGALFVRRHTRKLV